MRLLHGTLTAGIALSLMAAASNPCFAQTGQAQAPAQPEAAAGTPAQWSPASPAPEKPAPAAVQADPTPADAPASVAAGKTYTLSLIHI